MQGTKQVKETKETKGMKEANRANGTKGSKGTKGTKGSKKCNWWLNLYIIFAGSREFAVVVIYALFVQCFLPQNLGCVTVLTNIMSADAIPIRIPAHPPISSGAQVFFCVGIISYRVKSL